MKIKYNRRIIESLYSIMVELGLNEIVNIIIIIAIIIIIIKILQIIAYPLTKYSAASNVMSGPVWGFISRMLSYVLLAIIVSITVLWIIWNLINTVFGILFPILPTVVKMFIPPFAQLIDSGLFQLWDDLFASILQLSPTGVVRAFMNFFNNSGKYIISTVVPDADTVKKSKEKEKKKKKKKKDSSEYVIVDNSGKEEIAEDEEEDAEIVEEVAEDTEDAEVVEEANDTETEETEETEKTKKDANRNATKKRKNKEEEDNANQTKIDKCIEKKSTPITSSMDPIEKIKAKVNNSKVSLSCKAQSLGDFDKYK